MAEVYAIEGDRAAAAAVLREMGVIADIRGNVLALKAVLGDLEHLGVGDCVSGQLWPRETAAPLVRLGWPTIRCDQDRRVTDWPPAKQYPSNAFACRALRRSESTGSPHDAYSARLVTFREPWPSVTDYIPAPPRIGRRGYRSRKHAWAASGLRKLAVRRCVNVAVLKHGAARSSLASALLQQPKGGRPGLEQRFREPTKADIVPAK